MCFPDQARFDRISVIQKTLIVNRRDSKIRYTASMVTPKQRQGRPPADPAERLVQRSIRLLPAHWRKVDENGLPWLRELIENAKPIKQSAKPESEPQ
jgi:hypothetical protein